jgi:acyl-CoA synthetase (AMP-forming)/AMP-acid ligase II
VTLDKVLARGASASSIAERVALRGPEGELTYGELAARARALAAAMEAAEFPETIALAEGDPARSLVLLLAALEADRKVLLLDPREEPLRIGKLLEEAATRVVVTESDPGQAARVEGVRLHRAGDLSGSAVPARKLRRATDPVLFLSSASGAVVHSHFSVSAMHTALFSFILELRRLRFVCTRPIAAWEELCGALGALAAGATIVSLPRGCAAEASGEEFREAYAIVRREELDERLREGRPPEWLRRLRYLFVSTGPFESRWRRKVEKLLDRPIFPLWGAPEFGPAVAPHPTWFPRAGHGFPLVNVSLVPLDPATGQLCVVPWEMLERAEAAVDTMSAMVGYVRPEATAAVRVGKMVRSRLVASIDHVGIVYLHGPVPEVARGA